MKRTVTSVLKMFLFLLVLVSFPVLSRPVNAVTYVEKTQEFRGVWVATVSNIDIAQQLGSSASAIATWKKTYLQILDTCESYHINAIVFQVRPMNDAFWDSDVSSWSRYLIGTEGTDPGWDPLEWMVEVTHARGMEYHAWMNPYRASSSVLPSSGDYTTELTNYLATLPDDNWAKNHPDCLVRGDQNILLNPGKVEVRAYLYSIIEELVTKYDIDAIHFDDYFYNGVKATEDAADYTAYCTAHAGTDLSKADWRREQVNLLIQGIHDRITLLNASLGKTVQFGISPCGVWAASPKLNPGNTSDYVQEGGMDVSAGSYSAYADLFADTRKWVRENWIDYILPQNYGKIDDGQNEVISAWWAKECAAAGVKCYIGLAIYRFASDLWSGTEVDNQMTLAYADGVDGFCLFNYANLAAPETTNHAKCLSLLKTRWTHPALTPIAVGAEGENENGTATVIRHNNTTTIKVSGGKNVFGYNIWRTDVLTVPDYSSADLLLSGRSSESGIAYTSQADNSLGYNYYLEPVYLDGTVGNIASVSSKAFVNSRPDVPTITFTFFNLYLANNQSITIEGTASDPDGDALAVTIYHFDYETGSIIRTIKLTDVTDGVFQVTLPLSKVLTGESYFRVIVSDGALSAKTDSAHIQVVSELTPEMLPEAFFYSASMLLKENASKVLGS